MNTIPVKCESEVPSPHIMFIDATPEAAALAFEQKFKQEAPTVYTLGQRAFIPITIEPERFWQSLSNENDDELPAEPDEDMRRDRHHGYNEDGIWEGEA